MTPDSFTIKEQMLPVGEGHELYVHEWGSKTAPRTFLFLHGGPGSGCNDGHKELFDGNRDHVIFFDQRGSGKSTPAGSLESNATANIVKDIEKILHATGTATVTLVGGSWGSCLAFVYALAHPERVTAMVLRGIFTATQSEIDHIDKGGFRQFFPEVWDAFLARTPEGQRTDPASYHGQRVVGEGERAIRESAYAYSELEDSVSALDGRHTPEDIHAFSPAGTRIEVHYIRNGCFLTDHYILDNIHKLRIPVWLVQGRYDMVCPPITAYEAHKRLPNSRLIFTLAGHSGNDRGNYDAVRSIISTLSVRDENNNEIE